MSDPVDVIHLLRHEFSAFQAPSAYRAEGELITRRVTAGPHPGDRPMRLPTSTHTRRTLVAVFTGAVAFAAVAVPAQAQAAPPPSPNVVSSPIEALSALSAADYWTPARMASAIPAHLARRCRSTRHRARSRPRPAPNRWPRPALHGRTPTCRIG